MNRPETGPMQFPGDTQPGLYVDRYEAVRLAQRADDAISTASIDGYGRRRMEETLQACAKLLRSHVGITHPQRARLEE